MHALMRIVVLSTALALPLAGPAHAQGDAAPQTPWGAPDLQGVWDFRTITPLQRPEDLGDRDFLTEEEAANLEQQTVERNEELTTAPPSAPRRAATLAPTTTFGWTAVPAPSALVARP